jgi:sugar phosphate isomerase/epimerase
MYRSLNAESLGIRGRQNELIELTLTHKFRALDIDIQELVKQIDARGQDHATRFLLSANLKVGNFELPVDFGSSDATFQSDVERLGEIARVAESMGATRCTNNIVPYCQDCAYHENFERHRERISRVAQLLAPHKIHLGLGFLAPRHLRELGDSQFITSPDQLLTLIQTIVDENVGLCLDTWHWYVSGTSIDKLKRFAVEKIVAVRLADVPPEADLERITEQDRLLPGSTNVVPNVEWLRWLSEQGYAGPITPYCHPSQFVGCTRTQSVGQAAAALNLLLQAVGGTALGAGQKQVATAS